MPRQTTTSPAQRIAMVGPFGLEPKGTMRYRALPMAKALAARGLRVSLWLPPWDCPQFSGQTWEDDDVEIHNLSLPYRIPLTFAIRLSLRLLGSVLRWQPDVIHCFKPKAYAGIVHWLIYTLRRVGRTLPPIVVDSDDWEGEGGWNDVLESEYSFWQKRLFARQERWGLRHADALTLASRELVGLARRADALYVSNGVSRHRWAELQQARRGSPGRQVLLLTRLVEFEPEWITLVWQKVQAAVPDARLVIAGRGSPTRQRRLDHALHEAGCAGQVTRRGSVPYHELPDLFADTRVALFPAADTRLNRAKCPARMVEALAAGVPCVAHAVGEHKTFIDHGSNGYLAEPGDLDALAAFAIKLLAEDALCTQLADNAGTTILKGFLWEDLITRVEEAYQRAGACVGVDSCSPGRRR